MQDELKIYGEKTREAVERITEPPDIIFPGAETAGSTRAEHRSKKRFNYLWVLAIPIILFVLVALWWQSIQLAKLEKSAQSFGELKQGLGLALENTQKQADLVAKHSEESQLVYQNLTAFLDSIDHRLKMVQGSVVNAFKRHPLPDSAKNSLDQVKEEKGETATQDGNH
jgi:hypothetical protein